LVDYQESRFNEIKKSILKHLAAFDLEPLQIIPIAARDGDNIAKKSNKLNWYQGPTVLEALDKLKPPVEMYNLPLRFPVQDIYEIDGEKVIVGRIESGKMEKNQNIILLPSQEKTQLKYIKKWQQELEKAGIGHCLGITLTDNIKINRGQIACEKNKLPVVTNKFMATIFWLSDNSYTTNEEIIFKCVTEETFAKIKKIHKLIDSSTLEIIQNRDNEIKTTEVAEVEIETALPIVIDKFKEIPEMGRFVLVAGEDIVGGGIVTSN